MRIWEELKLKIPGLDLSVILSGILLGLFGILLVVWGNPANTGICISSFLQNIAGSLGLHNNMRKMYLRPEIMGLVLGSFGMALATRNFVVRGGASPIIRFILGFFTIVGSAIFIGCPIKLLLRMSAGDLTTLLPAVGLVIGIWFGVRFFHEAFYLGEDVTLHKVEGVMLPVAALVLVGFLFYRPQFIYFTKLGSGALHAPWFLSLGVGLILGVLCQRSRFCVVGSIRNYLLAKDKSLLIGLLLMIVVAFIASLIWGTFHLGMYDQPASHLEHFWSFLGMFLVGLAATFLGSCPFRQLILAGQGDIDAGVTTLGMVTAGAFVHNWHLISTAAGPTFNGKIAVLIGIVFCFVVGIFYKERS